jgi:hypothetical protein
VPRHLILAAGLMLCAAMPAAAQIADEMTCDQAIAYYEKHGVIQVIANGRFAVPVRVGVPVAKAATLQCEDQGSYPRPYAISTKDAWRCVIAVTC